MTKTPKRKRPGDLNQIAKRIVDTATGETDDDVPSPTSAEADPGSGTGAGRSERSSGAPPSAQKSSRK